MIKAVIFDLNGIFIQSPFLSDRFETDFGIPKDVFMPKFTELMKIIRQPNAKPAFQYWEPLLKEWNINLSEQQLWDYWFKSETPSSRVIDFARQLKEKGIKVFILSNNFKERAEYYGHYPWIHDSVDKLYFSWQTGFVKPDVKAWELVLSENNLKPKDCIYFDDQDTNLKSGEEAGIKSFMFTNELELERIVNDYLI